MIGHKIADHSAEGIMTACDHNKNRNRHFPDSGFFVPKY